MIQRRSRRGNHLCQRDIVLAKPFGRDEHLVLLHFAAEDLDVRDSRHGLQAAAKRPLAQGPQLHRRHRLGSHSHHHKPAGRRRERHHPWHRGRFGKHGACLDEPLAYQLAGLDNAGRFLENRRHH